MSFTYHPFLSPFISFVHTSLLRSRLTLSVPRETLNVCYTMLVKVVLQVDKRRFTKVSVNNICLT